MGGILGKLSFEQDEPLARPVLAQTLDARRGRGTGAGSIHIEPGFAPGSCDDEGFDSDRSNGRDVRATLERAGHVFGSVTDAELIIAPSGAHSHRLWSLLMLEFWFRGFVDGDAAEEPAGYAVLRAA